MTPDAASERGPSSERIVMHKRRRLKGAALRAARPTALFLLEFHHLLLSVLRRQIVLLDQGLRQTTTNRRQCVAYFGDHHGQEARLAAAQGGDEGEEGVEVFLGPGLEFAGFQGDAGHYVDEGTGYVEDLFDLQGWC